MVSLLGILECVPWSSSTYRQVASSILTLHLINPVHGSIVLQCWDHVPVGLEWQAMGPRFREMSVHCVRRCGRKQVLLKNKPAMVCPQLEMQLLWAPRLSVLWLGAEPGALCGHHNSAP